MKTIFIKYKFWVEGGHAMLDGEWVERSKIMEIENLLDLNDEYKHIVDVKVLLDGNTNIRQEEGPFSD